MNGKLPVAILWHMHQPYYKHPQTSEFVLPWVRLHASKDYLHMARLLQEFPRVKVNFTMVPSLRDQLEDYARGADDEDTRSPCARSTAYLTGEERAHILRRFFSIHHGNVIHRLRGIPPAPADRPRRTGSRGAFVRRLLRRPRGVVQPCVDRPGRCPRRISGFSRFADAGAPLHARGRALRHRPAAAHGVRRAPPVSPPRA